MRLTKLDGHYVFECKPWEKDFPKEHGFRYNSIIKGKWASDDHISAVRLIKYAEPELLPSLNMLRTKLNNSIANSFSTDGPDDFPVPDGLSFLPFQRGGLNYAINHPLQQKGVLIADEMGLGKTVQAIGIINAMKPNDVLVVTPASLKANWYNELGKWLHSDYAVRIPTPKVKLEWSPSTITIINYEMIPRLKEHLAGHTFSMVIIDECLPYAARVITEVGAVPIGKIVDDELDIRVLSWDASCNEAVFKPITRYIKNPLGGRSIIEIACGGKSIRCTGNHKIWVEDIGYVRADEIKVGQTVRVVRSRLQCQQKERGSKSKILLNKLLCKMAYVATKIQRYCKGGEQGEHLQSRTKAARSLKEDEGGKYECGVLREKVKRLQGVEKAESGMASRGEGWEREDYSAPANVVRLASGWLRARVCREYEGGSEGNGRDSQSLQDRHCLPIKTIGSRGGRELSQGCLGSRTRQEEDFCIELARVDRVKVHKLSDNGESGAGGVRDQDVYCLEVEGNHNFFADGILVSNCHYVKNPKSQRGASFRPVRGVQTIKGDYRIALTGTPIPNKVTEIHNVLSWILPEAWGNRWQFENRYCEIEESRFGRKIVGGKNLKDLGQRMRALSMVRRLKKDVLTDLPPKVRQVIELPSEGHTELLADELRSYDRWNELKQTLELEGKHACTEQHRRRLASLRDEVTVAFNEMARIRLEVARAKLPLALELIRDSIENGQKVLAFAHHREILEEIFNANKSHAVSITGATKKEFRQPIVEQFQNLDDIRLAVLSYKAAGVGLTLTKANQVDFVEMMWVPDDLSQAEDRAHRHGQKNSVLVRHVVMQDSLDARMAKRCVEKQELSEKVLG